MNSIEYTFSNKKNNILNIYFTAGYPEINSTTKILKILQRNKKVDIIEIGLPYSDPLSDGIIIQNSNKKSISNGMSTSFLFKQLGNINKHNYPIIIMGYYNQFISFGEKKFLEKCADTCISGLIFPDLPLNIYIKKYKKLFEYYNILPIFLISPFTSNNRIKILSNIRQAFLYIISSSITTGSKVNFGFNEINFFKRIKSLKLKIPKLIGFGISNKNNFKIACKYSEGAVIGSEFIKILNNNNMNININNFFKNFN